MLFPDQVLPFLNHADADVRRHASKYLSKLGDAAPLETANEIWRAIDTFGARLGLFGVPEAAGFLRTLSAIPQNESSVARAVEMLAKPIAEEGVAASLSRYFTKISVELIIQHRDQILPKVDDESRMALDHRLALQTMTGEELWQGLLEIGTKAETVENSAKLDFGTASRVVDALCAHPQIAIPRAVEVLHDPQDRYWLETWCIDLLGQLRHNPAIDILIDAMMNDEGDFMHPKAARALGRMNPEQVVPKLEQAYDPSDPDGIYERMRIPESLGRIKHPLAEAALIRLLERETDSEVTSAISAALVDLCTTDGLEPLRKVVVEERYDPMMANVMDELATLAKMTDYHPPELEQWTKVLAKDLAEQEQRQANLRKMTGSKSDADMLRKMIQTLSKVSDPELKEEYETQQLPVRREAVLPYRRESPKVGRNDPCPCGSGKKYKKCCGN
jgi:HEAT repeat protein